MKYVFPKSSSDIVGLIHYFPSLKPYVDLSSNSTSEFNASITIDPFITNKDWISADDDKSLELFVYFPKQKIVSTNYSLQTGAYTTTVHFPKCFDVYGFTGEEWEIASNVSLSGMNERNFIKVFPFSNQGPFEAFKIKLTCDDYSLENDSSLTTHFILHKIDFFGILLKEISHCNSFKRKNLNLFIIQLIMMNKKHI